MRYSRLSRVSLMAVVATALAVAQATAKRPLTHKDYDSWQSITNQALSRDGKTLAYAVFPQEGDGQLVILDIASGRETRAPIGALPPPPEPNPEATEEGPPRTPGVRIFFTEDGRHVVSTTFPAKADTDRARKEKKRAEAMPKGGIVIVSLPAGAATAVPDVKSVQVPEKGPSVIAYLKEPAPADPKASAAAGESAAPASGSRTPQYGSDLIVRDLRTPAAPERQFAGVTEFALSKDGATLVYTVSAKDEAANGVYVISPLNADAPKALVTGKGRYLKPTFDRLQTQLAFLGAPADPDVKSPRFRLYLWDRKSPAPAEIVGATPSGVRDGFVLYDRAAVSFSRDGSRVFAGVAPASTAERSSERTPPAKPEAAAAGDKAVADLWHWKDPLVQPMQKVRATQERNRSYRAVYHIAEKRFVQLADPDMSGISVSDNGRWAIGTDDRAFRPMVDYDGNYADYYLVDTLSGERKPLLTKHRASGFGAGVDWSPAGDYVLFYKGGDWYTAAIPSGKHVNLTGRLGVKFENEEHDSPSPAGAYGSAGWTRDGKVLVYDRYDVWLIEPDGSGARNATSGLGRKQNLQFRVVRLDRAEEAEEDERGIDPAKPVLLRAENLRTRDSGVWNVRLSQPGNPVELVMGPRNYRPLLKAKEAPVVIATATTFRDEPDLLVTDEQFRIPRKVTSLNPQRENLRWGSAELIRFRSTDGVPLDGVLYKPEDFDATRKYPLIVYIYERLSSNLHNFVAPRPGHSINISYYVSNGYLVLTPDIVYSVGAPGPSALKCVLPAVEAVASRGYVKEDAIGIQGHSWGGYQIAYMLTQTNRFRAAEAGAPVANMISAYNGIRWGTGLPRQFQYEQTQSRIGGSPWQYPLRFIENSPVFHVDRVETPLLILHNDNDDAVPWYQGIELFLSLRRLNKEAYLFNYNGEPHGIRKRPNQKDFTVRLQQFFDHYLKGAPAPEWMEKGIPFIDREAEKERFATAATDGSGPSLQ